MKSKINSINNISMETSDYNISIYTDDYNNTKIKISPKCPSLMEFDYNIEALYNILEEHYESR